MLGVARKAAKSAACCAPMLELKKPMPPVFLVMALRMLADELAPFNTLLTFAAAFGE